MKLFAAFLSFLILCSPAHAASPDMDIAAVVGGDAISSYDVESRLRFLVATTRLSDSPEVLKQIRPQVLQSLVDEKLQLQEAARNDITVTDKEIQAATAEIEQQRDMKPGGIARMLAEKKVPPETFTNQLRAQLSWNRLVNKKVRARVRVSDEELALAEKKISAPVVTQEMKIAVLSLPVDKRERAPLVRQAAERLVREVRGGADFEEVARQLGRTGKPETFWVRPAQLDKDISRALAGARVGTITDPVPTETGYTIVKVYDMRALPGQKPKEVAVRLKEILLKLKPDADVKEADVLLQIGEAVSKNPGTCDDPGVANIKDLQDFDIAAGFREEKLSEMPQGLRIIAENLKIGDISTPFASSEGIRLYMLCDKHDAPAEPIDRTRLMNLLMLQRMELESQKYMRNLRRDTFIEVR